nr:NosD domain-containing protein [Candidatus Sigynarchaeota archaeon]
MERQYRRLVLLAIPVIFTLMLLGSDARQSSMAQARDRDISASALTPHSKISITGNTALDAFCAGNGTTGLSWASAHRISGYDIDAIGSGDCISISSTNRFLIISNCLVRNTATGSGIKLNTCLNINISRINATGTYYGIYASYSDYNIIEKCRLTSSQNGIYLYDTDYNQILNNTAWGTSSNGLLMDYGRYNNFTANFLSSGSMSVLNFYDQANYNNILRNYFNGSVRDDNQYASPPNYFNDTYNGNYYKDYTTKYPGAPSNGIVWYTPYLIS